MWISVACQLAPTSLSDSRRAKGMSRTWRRRSQPLQPMASTQAMRNVISSVCCNYHWPPWFVYWYTYYQQRECSWYFLCSIFGLLIPSKQVKGYVKWHVRYICQITPKKWDLLGTGISTKLEDIYFTHVPVRDMTDPERKRKTTLRLPMLLPHELLEYLHASWSQVLVRIWNMPLYNMSINIYWWGCWISYIYI